MGLRVLGDDAKKSGDLLKILRARYRISLDVTILLSYLKNKMSHAEAFLLSSVLFIMASSHDETDTIFFYVGKFTKKDCFKEYYAKCTVKNLIVLDELPVDDQRVIKLRVGSDYIKIICLHHQCVYFTYFVSTTFQTKHCCDPLKKHRKKFVVGN